MVANRQESGKSFFIRLFGWKGAERKSGLDRTLTERAALR
jgi:hypothetical protein